eukprot:jgi/Chlat1/8682/Chrsp88S08057
MASTAVLPGLVSRGHALPPLYATWLPRASPKVSALPATPSLWDVADVEAVVWTATVVGCCAIGIAIGHAQGTLLFEQQVLAAKLDILEAYLDDNHTMWESEIASFESEVLEAVNSRSQRHMKDLEDIAS